MKKIVILGALGMAGHIMAEYLNSLKKYEIYGVARTKDTEYVSKELDVTNFNELEEYLEESKPDIVINCIGILVSKSNSELTTAIQINSYLPQFLSELGNKLDYKLIHISTDCVFSGKDGQYSENSFRDGDDNYARTKALGEVINEKDLTIRTSIIGPELKSNGTGLLDWFLKQENTISGYSKAFWSGVTTLELAKQMEAFIDQDIKGLFQLCPDDKISKYDLLKEFAKVWNKTIEIGENSDYKVDKSLVCTRTDFIYTNNQRPNFEQMLLDTKNWIDLNKNYYQHYNL
ncbi:MAG: SDR family oxidoreductase [Campylobacteraceae bacterium]|nr:SDR family oxidoreductase [Campylobacteraceae bacterium]